MTNPNLIKYLESFLTPRRRDLYHRVISNRTNFITVATEDVYQLHNTSAVIRSCDVFGVQNIHVVEERNRRKIDREIAMGAQKWVSLNRYHTSRECLKNLKNLGYDIVATTPGDKTVSLESFYLQKPVAIFFGTEKDGLSQEVLNQADHFLSIPMYGFTESLNISVSAAIILQNLTEKLRKGKINWELSDNEKNAVKFEWLQKNFKNFDLIISQYNEIRET